MDKNDPHRPPTDEELEGLNENWTDAEVPETPEPDAAEPESPAEVPEPTEPEPALQPATAPEMGKPSQPVPQLVNSTTASAAVFVEPEDEDADEPAGQYDPNRGDHVDVLNDTTPPPPPPKPVAVPKKKGKKKRWPWIVLVLLLLAGGAYFVYSNHKTTPAAEQATVTKTTTPTTPTPATITTKHYDSTTYSMGMDYPDTWKLNDGDTSLTVTSPAMSLKKSDGTTTASGYIQLSIEATQTSLPEFSKGSAIAALPSEKLTYTKPTPNQRTATNLTFASYSTTTNNGWDALYVTGDNAYTLGQTIPMSDIIQTDPLVQVHFFSCTDQTCSGTPTVLSLQASEWQNTAVSLPLKTIIQSFTFN